jgi:hypothetical protein
MGVKAFVYDKLPVPVHFSACFRNLSLNNNFCKRGIHKKTFAEKRHTLKTFKQQWSLNPSYVSLLITPLEVKGTNRRNKNINQTNAAPSSVK